MINAYINTDTLLKALTLALFLVPCGCATSDSSRSLYQDLGGEETIDAVVYDTIVLIADDHRVVDRFRNVDIERFRQGLTEYICSVSGGPCEYTGESMRTVHAGHNYTDTEFNTIVELLIEAMEANEVPVSAQNRLLARLAPDYRDIVYQ